MAGDDLAVVGNQHRIAETEALDRRCDLLDLSLAMTSRVSRIGLKRLDRYALDRWTKLSHPGRQNRECRSRPPCIRRVRHFSYSYVWAGLHRAGTQGFSPSANWGRDRGCPARGFGRPVRGRRAPNVLRKTSLPRAIASRWVPWIEEARCPPSGFTAHPHRGGPHAGYGPWAFHFPMLPTGHAYVGGRPRLSADRLNRVARARTECNTGGSPISGGRRNDVEERRTGAGSAKDSELEEPDACGVGRDLEAGP